MPVFSHLEPLSSYLLFCKDHIHILCSSQSPSTMIQQHSRNGIRAIGVSSEHLHPWICSSFVLIGDRTDSSYFTLNLANLMAELSVITWEVKCLDSGLTYNVLNYCFIYIKKLERTITDLMTKILGNFQRSNGTVQKSLSNYSCCSSPFTQMMCFLDYTVYELRVCWQDDSELYNHCQCHFLRSTGACLSWHRPTRCRLSLAVSHTSHTHA